MKVCWEKEHLHLGSVLAKHCTYAVGDVEEELTTCQRSVALPAAMVKQQPLSDILGRLKMLTGKESAKTLYD